MKRIIISLHVKDDLQLIHQASSMLKPHLKTSHIPFATTETHTHTHTHTHMGVTSRPAKLLSQQQREDREREKFSSSSSFQM
jgi:hypothetical protein